MASPRLRLRTEVFGLSTQDTAYQQEMVKRLEVPFDVLSDEHLSFAHALRLPTFVAGGMTLLKRLTIIAQRGRIEHAFYPVFPPDTHAQEVIAWLERHPIA
jgi:peroxiredoxin